MEPCEHIKNQTPIMNVLQDPIDIRLLPYSLPCEGAWLGTQPLACIQQANITLEKRVKSRTRELSQALDDLQITQQKMIAQEKQDTVCISCLMSIGPIFRIIIPNTLTHLHMDEPTNTYTDASTK